MRESFPVIRFGYISSRRNYRPVQVKSSRLTLPAILRTIYWVCGTVVGRIGKQSLAVLACFFTPKTSRKSLFGTWKIGRRKRILRCKQVSLLPRKGRGKRTLRVKQVSLLLKHPGRVYWGGGRKQARRWG